MGLKQPKTGFEAILTVAVAPPGTVFSAERWAQRTKDSVENRKKAIRTEIRKDRASLKAIAHSKDITVEELLEEPIFTQMQENKRKSWRKQFQALNDKFPDGSTKYSRGVDSGKEKYKRARLEYRYLLFGSKKNKGLIPLARMALTGDRGLKKYLKPDADEIITGHATGRSAVADKPIRICPPEKLAEFKKELNHQIHESGMIIIKGGLTENDINAQNEQLNRLIERYRLPEIEARVDFIIVDFADRPVKRLGLRIKVSKKD